MSSDAPIWGIPPDLVREDESDVLPLADEANYGMTWPGMDQLRTAALNGRGIKIGVVDTGVDDSHPLLAGRVFAKDFTGSSRGSRDVNGHGTHCTGTNGASNPNIGVAYEATLYHGKGLGDSGSGSMSALLNAMEWCASEGCELISCSWGGGSGNVDPATNRRFQEWADRGIWLNFAAGNSGGNTNQTDPPGNSLNCINWAALDREYKVASFSSAGSKIDQAGPGVLIWSLAPGGRFAQMSGTSMATPFGNGVLALYRNALKRAGKPIPNVYDLRKLLVGDATDVGAVGIDRRTGPGAVTPILLAKNLVPDPPLPGS